MTCAACRKLGLEVILILKGKRPATFRGNLLLERLMDADIRFIDVPSYDEINSAVDELIDKLKSEDKGHITFQWVKPVGLGACGYVDGAFELFKQADIQDMDIDYVVNAVGSGGTSAGLEVGVRLAKKDSR